MARPVFGWDQHEVESSAARDWTYHMRNFPALEGEIVAVMALRRLVRLCQM